MGSEVEYFLCFEATLTSARLSNPPPYSDYQSELHDLIQKLHDEGMGYRKIAEWLNEHGYKAVCGKPRAIRVDNGPEFIYKDLDLWDWSNGVTLVFSRPGSPTENAIVESFNGKVRAECVDQNRFLSLDDAQSKCEAYWREYNEERPHSTIDNKTPMEFMTPIGQTSRQVA
jgi:transposase InsO family protein